ncbi:AAA family ATPase [Tenacibaculum sp. XPcli2-G]|uniref:AAA family ATPase n=1 Tax=Tenacibaculum sp. XPcli2-G TaxID=2954503 RepID=UPI002096E421|nr:AAA family ATPase [Tenacibaculum sp. XPcli2-G]MCO7185002.1 AAA family ATPase [Tenacibaculum sp. XPcli2-G]
MIDLLKVHESIYLFLKRKREDNPKLYYSFRKSNHGGKLEDGYWFYGNDDYLAISFWSGMDWKNRTPNIVFMINKIGDCFLEINLSDSTRKMEFVENNILPEIQNIEEKGRRYCKFYSNGETNAIESILDSFLSGDKLIIDKIINKNKEFIDKQMEEDIINFISPKEFSKRKKNVDKYRDNKLKIESGEKHSSYEIRPTKIKSLFVKKYGFINEFKLEIDDFKNQWIFITGKNGSGKTNLLRAIAAFLGQKHLSKNDLRESSIESFQINAELWYKNKIEKVSRNGNNKISVKPITQGLAMYGPYRLEQTSTMVKDDTFRKALSKTGTFKSLFEDSSKLLSLDKQLEFWKLDSKRSYNINENRIKQILSLLPKIIPDLRQVEYFRKGKNKFEFKYLLQTQGSDELMPLKWNELSSGNKSILNLVSDIIIRLFYQQPKVTDPSELRGIVLIDEIDLHLHPKAQRDLVVILSETFPLIQFIVSTHSPIPLLGAPKNSAIYVVKRNWVKGVFTERLDDKVMFDRILPNTILNSPIFGMDDLVPFSKEDEVDIILDDKYSDAILYNKLEKDVESYLTNENIKDLIEIFKNHDEK